MGRNDNTLKVEEAQQQQQPSTDRTFEQRNQEGLVDKAIDKVANAANTAAEVTGLKAHDNDLNLAPDQDDRALFHGPDDKLSEFEGLKDKPSGFEGLKPRQESEATDLKNRDAIDDHLQGAERAQDKGFVQAAGDKISGAANTAAEVIGLKAHDQDANVEPAQVERQEGTFFEGVKPSREESELRQDEIHGNDGAQTKPGFIQTAKAKVSHAANTAAEVIGLKPHDSDSSELPQQQQQQQQNRALEHDSAPPAPSAPMEQQQLDQPAATNDSSKSVGKKVSGVASGAAFAFGHAAHSAAEWFRYKTNTLNAIDLLINQHRESATLLDKALATEDPKSRLLLFEKVSDALLIHMRIEEEIFYPSARKECPDEKKFVEHAEDEHKEAKELIAKLLRMDPADSQFKPTLQELTDDIKHHVEKEESDLLPTAKKAMSADTLKHLGNLMHERVEHLSKNAKPREMAFLDTDGAPIA